MKLEKMLGVGVEYAACTNLLQADDFRSLFEDSFIETERVDFDKLFSGVFEGFELVGQYDDGKLVGMMHFVEKTSFVHLNYFAIKRDFRGRGYGSACLTWLKKNYPGKSVVVDVEEIDSTSEDNEYRIRRQKFYEKNGFVHGDHVFDWRGIFFTFLHCGELQSEEFLKHITYIFPDIKDVRKI